jgi:TnpA family transposase
MSAPQELTQAQRDRLQTAHHLLPRREMVRYWSLSEEDRKHINERRRDHNRLGFAIQLCLLRYPGWPLGPGELPPQNLLKFVAEQLEADALEVSDYAKRPQTRTDHVQELARLYRLRQYSSPFPAMLREHLRGEAVDNESAFTLVQSALEWLRSHSVIVPALMTLEALIRSVRSEVERTVYLCIEEALTGEQKKTLDGLLELSPKRGSMLGWLRRVPSSCSASGILDLIRRLLWVRDLGVKPELADAVPAVRLRQLAARGARHSLSHFRRFPDVKRHAILAAFLLYVTQELTDRTFAFHNRLFGRMFHTAETNRWTHLTVSGTTVNEKLHNHSRLTRALADAHRNGTDLRAAVESVLSWERLEQEALETSRLTRPLDSANYETFRSHYPQFRQYTPKLLEAFRFDAIPALKPLLAGIETLRQMNREGLSQVPADAPRGFVKPKWTPFVFAEKGIDRCYYELCVLSEMSNGLRSGDLWVDGSRHYLKFDNYMIEPAKWEQQRVQMLEAEDPLLDCEAYLSGRKKELDQQLKRVSELIQQRQLQDVRLENNKLVVSPLTRAVPEQTEHWAEKVYDLLPRVSLTQLLEEVSSWSNWPQAFTHLYTGQPVTDPACLLTAILAAATNLGKTKMADATEGYTADRLAWVEDWYLREATYARALASTVQLQGQIPLVEQWGSGRTSSSDGQAFPIAFKKPVMANVNAKYGRDPVSMIYTHLSDRYAPYHAKAISSTVRDATHVLDGLLYHDPDLLQIEEHYTDTAGYTDHIFALCHLLGFRFAPRIRDLGDHRLFCFEKPSIYDGLKPLIAGRIHSATIRKHWDEAARFVTSIRQGTASASLLVAKLAANPRQTHLAAAFREIGRIERSLFTLTWLQDPDLRRRVTIGLNKGEAHHTLKRAIRFYRRGSIPDRTQLEQDLHAMALNLVVAAITLWNTAYLDQALKALQQRGIAVPSECLPHISPLGWEHITITGTYQWKGSGPTWGKFRPLRLSAINNLAAQTA